MAPDPSSFDRVFKFVILGAKSVGKKTLLRSFCTEGDDESIWTSLNFDDEKILIEATVTQKWEESMSGENDAIALVFSTTDTYSFEYTLELYNQIQKTTEKIPLVFIENKMDIVEESEMDKTLVEGETRKKHKRLYRVSALKEFNVMHPFAYLIEKLTRQKKDVNANERKQSSSVTSTATSPPLSTEAWVEPVQPENSSAAKRSKNDKCVLM
uniref:GTP-binding protein n=1 Tax=Caenorhabditis tropicalis TaxID=1561998 RepID=A0A1I7TTQ2_9PELO